MKFLFKICLVIISIGLLTACININLDGKQAETDNQEETEVQGEQEENNSSEDDEQEPAEENEDSEPNESEPADDGQGEKEVVLENEAFQIFEPVPDSEVTDRIIVRGLARVFEGTIQYEFEDGHFILDKGFTTASKGGPEWGDFEIIIDLDDATDGAYRVVLFEESAKNSSIENELIIPVQVISE